MTKNLFLLSLILSVFIFTQTTADTSDSTDFDSSKFDNVDLSEEYPSSDASDSYGICWKHHYIRKSQDPISLCPDGQYQWESNCYANCSTGFSPSTYSDMEEIPAGDSSEYGDGPFPLTRCWQDCPGEDWSTIENGICGITTPYFEGDGTSDEETCESQNPQGCENCHDFWFAKPNQTDCGGSCAYYCHVTCPPDMPAKHGGCAKASYPRPILGTVTCAPGQDLSYSARCYLEAAEGFICEDQVCLGTCPQGWTSCGALCTQGNQCETNSTLSIFGQNAISDLQWTFTNSSWTSVLGNDSPFLEYPICH